MGVLDVERDPLSWQQTRDVIITNTTAASLSVIGSFLVILAYFLQHSSKYKQTLFHLIVCLAFADFCASATIVISSVTLLSLPSGTSMSVCIGYRAVIHYFYLASFCWTVFISLHLYRSASQKPDYDRLYWIYHGISWIVPAIFVATLIGTGNIVQMAPQGGHSMWCHVNPREVWYFWFIPLILSMVISIVLYALTLSRYYQIRSGQITISIKASHFNIQKRISFFILTFIFCWLWDIIQHVIPYDEDKPIFAIAIVHAIFVPLQGFLNCLLYGFSSNLINLRTLMCMKKRPKPLHFGERAPLMNSVSSSYRNNMQKEGLSSSGYYAGWSRDNTDGELSSL
ncbi:hypothetical protein PROFUN_00525 [Planoprotostelium fungivorum]|uniref:G-protein coupled receptors family 2 profile 2 domain-containing protein n=1 Tax=Planoprotostelium fungivorum TaxID=1890364 RepID=A0A2P6N124_9EUKA|nr:hypothetical protein PROFUN_00525 [Planoprotostelium fungivorum]